MNREKFMNQSAKDMTIRELLIVIKIKAKKHSCFVDEMVKAMKEIEHRELIAKETVLSSPLQNPEILKIVQQLCEMDKAFTAMKKREANVR